MQVEFQTPEEDPESWFHLLVLHQNRAKRGPTSYIPEGFLPSFFHLVIWGHEHDCRIWPENSDMVKTSTFSPLHNAMSVVCVTISLMLWQKAEEAC